MIRRSKEHRKNFNDRSYSICIVGNTQLHHKCTRVTNLYMNWRNYSMEHRTYLHNTQSPLIGMQCSNLFMTMSRESCTCALVKCVLASTLKCALFYASPRCGGALIFALSSNMEINNCYPSIRIIELRNNSRERKKLMKCEMQCLCEMKSKIDVPSHWITAAWLRQKPPPRMLSTFTGFKKRKRIAEID